MTKEGDTVANSISRFIIYIILLSVHYAKIVAMVEDVVLDLLPYYTSLTCSIHSSMLVIINSWQNYHLLVFTKNCKSFERFIEAVHDKRR
jgi:hypothetical protein